MIPEKLSSLCSHITRDAAALKTIYTMTERDFFLDLEFRVCREFIGMRDQALHDVWCDGFIPEEFELVRDRCRMSGRVWIGFGSKRQECWRFILHLGTASDVECVDWQSLLPAENVTGWLAMDFQTQFMKVDPMRAVADLPSQTSDEK